jgi:hypothetical protein
MKRSLAMSPIGSKSGVLFGRRRLDMQQEVVDLLFLEDLDGIDRSIDGTRVLEPDRLIEATALQQQARNGSRFQAHGFKLKFGGSALYRAAAPAVNSAVRAEGFARSMLSGGHASVAFPLESDI